ncbi:hypothetical protein GCM10027610_003550 [Dactylosporangium cerinum]
MSVDEALRMVLTLPEVEQRVHGNHLGFRVRDRGFAYLCEDDWTMLVKTSREEQAALVEDDPGPTRRHTHPVASAGCRCACARRTRTSSVTSSPRRGG